MAKPKLISVTCAKPVFGIDLARRNYKPYNFAGFVFYNLPESIDFLKTDFDLTPEFLKTIQIATTENDEVKKEYEYVFKTLKGYEKTSLAKMLEDEISLFVYALQFVEPEGLRTNVNLYRDEQPKYLFSFYFFNSKPVNFKMFLNDGVYSDCKLGNYVKEKYCKLWAIFEKEPGARNEIENCILRAIEWVSRSSVELSSKVAITECFIALETLFNGEIENDFITKTLCDLADKCLDKNIHNYDIKKVIRKCYSARSQVVHGHKCKNYDSLKEYMITISKEIIIYVLDNYEKLPTKTGKGLLNWVYNNKS